MKYQKFLEKLSTLYQNWGQDSVTPINPVFKELQTKLFPSTTPNVMQLLNWAVRCLEKEEVYCEIGINNGATLIGALLDNPDVIAYAVDDFSQFDFHEEKINQLIENLANFAVEEQVVFCYQNFEEFFFDLKQDESDPKIGVYFYNGSPDYRSQLLGLLLTRLFLADQALIIVNNTNWQTVKQANFDFLASERKCRLLLDFQTPSKNHHTFGNGIQVFSWDVNDNVDYDWTEFAEKFRSEEVIKVIRELHFQVDIQKEEIAEKTYKEALSLTLNKKFKEASIKYQEILTYLPDHHRSLHDLGMIFWEMGDVNKAEELVNKAIHIDSSVSSYYYNFGLIREKQGKQEKAIQCYRQAIELDPKLVNAYNNLGNIFQRSGDLENAYLTYHQAISTNPNHFGSYLNLGNVLMKQNKFNEAIENYQKALKIQPKTPDILYNLGLAFQAKNDCESAEEYFGFAAYRAGKYDEAIAHFQKFLNTNIGDPYLYSSLADCYKQINKSEETIKIYQEAIKKFADNFYLYISLIRYLLLFGEVEKAISTINQAYQLFPNNIILKLTDLSVFPILYQNSAEINFYRERFINKLNHLIKTTNLDSPEQIKQALEGISDHTNFYLQYQGKDDLELQKIYGEYVHHVMARNYPQWVESLPQNPITKKEKIRIGYISVCMYNHTVAKLFSGWLKNHNKNNFEIYTYNIENITDVTTKEIAIYSNIYRQITSGLENICQQILADQLHILIFLDIGMASIMAQLAALRLAPIQCTTWFHPVTSGIPTIDYFLSSELMESENAQKHYSEKLILLPNIGISYPMTLPPEKLETRSFFKLKSEAIVYLSCQSLYKYLPQYDYIFATIAQQIPNAQFVFIARNLSEKITNVFTHRLKVTFAQYNINSEDHCILLQELDTEKYLSLHWISDIYLDTFTWSGGKTTLEAIGCNLPVVTCPGEFMRGRHSYGILKMLGVTETIASSETEYIDIAVRLGNDPVWRKSIVEKIKANHSNLYDDQECVRGLEDFYRSVVISK